ncbi:YjgD [Halapricum desulfuricans]|uniref:YjgD n=2 Tax=Halapricum desulfuricans TaxID=2841257 RepID=A0A897NTN9_9EURY|nr:YjgD [Halapricum desulfuricans]
MQAGEDFEALVEDNPEDVAALLERLDTEGTDVAALLNGSSEETNIDLGAASEASSPLSDAIDGNEAELAEGLESLAQIQRTGTLDDLLELSQVASLLMGAMDDEMVMSLSNLASELGGVADTAAEEDISRGLEDVLHSVGDVSEEEPEPVGAIGFAKALRDPEVKAGLGVALALVKALGRNVGTVEDTR